MRALILILLFWPAIALADEGLAPEDAQIEIVFEDRTHPPHPGEMVLLQIHGTFKVAVIREKLVEPDLTGFDWMQLGEDRWYKAREDGFEVLKFERRMALYPQTPGTLTVAPFTHQLELLSRSGETVPIPVMSNATQIDVAQPLPMSDWWFPVSGIEISDRWSNQPEALVDGGSALRIIGLTVLGTLPQRIPPMPEMTGAGVHVFPHPEHRIIALGPNGPVTRVFWRWTVRPKDGSAGYLNPMRLAYFDAGTRVQEEVVFSAQRIAHAGGPQTVIADDKAPASGTPVSRRVAATAMTIPAWAVPATGGTGLILGLAWVFLGLRKSGWQWPVSWRQDPLRAALRRAVRRRDAAMVRRAGHALCTDSGAAVPESLRTLDRALYGNGEPQPELGRVAQDVRKALRA